MKQVRKYVFYLILSIEIRLMYFDFCLKIFEENCIFKFKRIANILLKFLQLYRLKPTN